MKFNIDKWHTLSAHRKQNPIIYNYIMNAKHVTPVTHHPYLGIEMQQDFKWSQHINNTTNKAQRSLNMLKRNLKQASSTVRSQAYTTIVRPQLEYASSIWDPYTQTDIQKLDKVQKYAARWTLQDYSTYTSVSTLQKQLKWPPLAQRRLQTRLTVFYKITNNLIAIPVPPYILKPTRTTRSTPTADTHTYRQLHTATDSYKYSFFPRTIINWNSLPNNTKTLPTVLAFKASISPLTQLAY